MIAFSGVRWGILEVTSLTIPPGVIAITGQNGAGKTILLELIAGIRIPESGGITIRGRKPREMTTGWVCAFPDLNMIFSRTRDEIASSLRFQHLPDEEIKTRIDEICNELGILSLLDRPVRTLSGGEKILVAIAAALVGRPEILILDETDAHLDIRTMLRIDTIISRLNITWLLYASHREDHIAMAEYVISLREGRIVSGPVPPFPHPERDLLPDPALWREINATNP